MRLYFVRHGESDANVEHVFSTRGFKHPLTLRGVAQAQALASHLSAHNITRMYSSPLQRAVQTAEILSKPFGLTATITDALREWDVGIFEGTTEQRGWNLHYQVQLDWFFRHQWESKMPGGESFLDIQARFVPFIQDIIRTPADNDIVLVGHGALYHAMLPHILENVDYAFVREHPLDNTSYVLAETHPKGLVCIEWCGIRV